MKKKYILSALLLMITNFVFSQSVPRGMNYQAVARDKAGEILSNQQLSLKISLGSQHVGNFTILFCETHSVKTNSLGLFNLTIGKGENLSGKMNEIPWSSENIWMEVGIKMENENSYVKISNTQLFAVPYAFHAGTATQLAGTTYVIPGTTSGNGNNTDASGPVPATSWQTTGNSTTNPPSDYFGTTDAKDLVFKTNGIERMRILSTGNITMNNSFSIGIDLTVGRDVTVNRDIFGKANLIVDSNLTVKKNANFNSITGQTIVKGPFLVSKLSPTSLTGTLQVDKSTNLNDSLNVNNNKPTLLSGTLRVIGVTDLYNSFSVNSQAPSMMTGTLRVDSDVVFKNKLLLDNANWNSTSFTTGAMVVAGGVGIDKNINIGGNARIAGQTTLNGQVKITDARPSENPDSGAVVVTGGVGIGKEISIRKFTHLYDSVQVDGHTRMQKTLTVNDSAEFKNNLTVTGKSTLNGSVNVKSPMKITRATSGQSETTYENYLLQVKGASNGIAIKVNGSKSLSNNFISFWDQNGMQGRIEGMATGQYSQTDDYHTKEKELSKKVLYYEEQVYYATVDEVAAGINVFAAATSTTACAGLGVCATVPIPSLIASTILRLAAATINLASNAVALDDANTDYSTFMTAAGVKNGVNYASGAGDYAEYMEMLDKNEQLFPGDIVGLKGGKITRITAGADKIMVVSVKPIILGNMPKGGNDEGYKKIAFLGQLPVKVIGTVNPGDYILPDGHNMGFGIAVSPSKIKASDIKYIVGTAWSGSIATNLYSTINVAVGLNVNDNQRVVENLRKRVSEIKSQLAESDNVLRQLVPGYQGSSPMIASTGKTPQIIYTVPTAEYILYHEFTRKEIEIAYDLIIKNLKENPETVKVQQKYIEHIETDPSLRNQAIDGIYSKLMTMMHERKVMDQQFSR